MADWKERIAGKCDAFEVFRLENESSSVSHSNNRLKGASVKQSSGLALRLVKDGKLGSVVAGGARWDDVPDMAERALAVAPYGPSAGFEFARPSTCEPVDNFRDEELSFGLSDLIDIGSRLLDGCRRRWPDLVCGSSVGMGKTRVSLVNSEGFDDSFEFSEFGWGVSVQASREGDMFAWSSGRNGVPGEDAIAAFFEEAERWVELGMNVVELEPGAYPVVITPNCLVLLLRVLEAGIKGTAVFEGRSPLTGRTGEMVLSPRFTMTCDPSWGRGPKTVPFDDEGVKAVPRAVFDGGRFTGPITDLEYAARLGTEPTGNGFRHRHIHRDRTLSSGVSIAAGNIRIAPAPGGPSPEELIASVKLGVYIDLSFDCWMGNVINGDFTGTLHRAYKIENGKLVGRLKHRAFAGNVYDLFGDSLQAVACECSRHTMGMPEDLEAPLMLVEPVNIA